MLSKKHILIAGTSIVIVGVAVWASKKPKTAQTPPPAGEQQTAAPTPLPPDSIEVPVNNTESSAPNAAVKTPAKNPSTNTPASTPTQPTPLPPTPQHGTYTTYSAALAESEAKAGKRVVLFFHAHWCPFCVEAERDFQANTDKIPSNVAVLKVNYDTETKLKEKYGVTYQHTFVQIDASGDMITRWFSGGTDNLIKNIK